MTKNIIRTVVALVVLVLIVWGVSKFAKPNDQQAAATSPCAIDINALILQDPDHALKTDKQIVQAMFDHYFSFFANRSQCPETSLKAAKLVSIGDIDHDVPDHFLANIVFELQPDSLATTKWASDEVSTTTDGWIKNKVGVLSIRASTTTSSYFLVI